MSPDPVKHCDVYRSLGCAHVDGFLCDMRACSTLHDFRHPKGSNMSNMRAKVKVSRVERFETCENLTFTAVSKPNGYPEDGSDEDNTYAKFSPSAEFKITVANPALFGKFEPGKKYYVDFTPAE